MSFARLVKGLTDEKLSELKEAVEREEEERRNTGPQRELTDRLKDYVGFQRCSLGSDERGRTKTTRINITFDAGTISIKIVSEQSSIGSYLSMETSFGNLRLDYSYGQSTIKSNTLTPVGLENWTVFDTLDLLKDVLEVVDERNSRPILDSFRVDFAAKYYPDTKDNSDEENTQAEYQIYRNIAPLLYKYGFDDVEVRYTLDRLEDCILTLYVKEKEVRMIGIACNRHRNVHPHYFGGILGLSEEEESDEETDEEGGESFKDLMSKEDLLTLIKACLPEKGEVVAEFFE
jgi:hypothetical protein